MSMNFFSSHNWLTFIDLLPLYAPLGVIGVWRWSVWLFQKITALSYHPQTPPSTPSPLSLSIVTPVYNEDPLLFQKALASWQRNQPDEIIAVIDQSDARCIALFKNFQKQFPWAELIITDVPGKRPALALGSRTAKGDIIALVDSDTVWDKNIKEILLAPFRNPEVGGVTCRQAVINPQTAAEKLFDMRLSLRYLHEYPYLMAVGDALTCLSGRTAVYRRSALLPVLPEMLNETFLWKKCISGEDKRLTSLVMRNGWKVRYQQNAVVRTVGMPGLKEFFRQNLRWSRNSWRTDLRLIFSGWTWKREPFFVYHLIDRAVQPFTLLLGPIYFFLSLWFHNTIAAGILLTWLLASRTVKLFPHLREKPRDLLTVPLFTFAQYHLAILKIYAFLSLDFQSWITRWHQSRLRRGFLELFPSQLATLSVLFALSYLSFSVAQNTALARENKKLPLPTPYTDDFSLLHIDEQEERFWQERANHTSVTYRTRLRETPALVLRKFNIPQEKMTQYFPKRYPQVLLPYGTEVKFSVDDLRHSLSSTRLPSSPFPPFITYRPSENLIHVKGAGTVVRLSTIKKALPANSKLLEETAPKEWILRARLYMSEGTTLILDDKEVKLLKLQSTPKNFVYIRSQHGNILIQGTHITSWDEEEQKPDTILDDGRAFIVAFGGGRMDVLDAEISYLGYPLAVARKYQHFGGSYGLSWKIENGSFGRSVLTGNVINSKLHHNYFGLYSYGASGMVIAHNEVFENIEYGIDPHDDSNNLIIEENFVHNNGNHGIIGSKRVVYSTIRNNRSTNNRLHGIMLDRDTNYNLVENNLLTGNTNGVALSASHMNLIRNNTMVANKFGIRGSSASSENILTENTIKQGEKGIYLYGDSRRNVIRDNALEGNRLGVHLKETRFNAIINSLKKDQNVLSLKLDASSQFTNFIQHIP